MVLVSSLLKFEHRVLIHVSDSTGGSFVLTRRLTAPSVPKVVSRAEADTIRNPQVGTRVVATLEVATTMAGTTTGADMAVDTTAVTTMPLVVLPATALVVMAVVAMVCF